MVVVEMFFVAEWKKMAKAVMQSSFIKSGEAE